MIKLIDLLKETINHADFNLSLKDFLDKYNQERHPGFTPKNQSLEAHGYINIKDIDPSEYDDWEELLSLPREQEKIQNLASKNQPLTPILLSLLKGYRGLVLDGHHRVAANIQQGKDKIGYILDLESLIDLWLNKNNMVSTHKIREDLLQKYLTQYD